MLVKQFSEESEGLYGFKCNIRSAKEKSDNNGGIGNGA